MAGTPLVLLPGMNCTAELWSPVLQRLGREALTPVIDGADLEDSVHRLLARLPDRFALTGLSLGGIVAMAMHRIAPHRITRIALLDTNALAPTDAQRAGWQQVRDRLTGGLTAAAYQTEILDLLITDQHRDRLAGPVIAMGERTGSALLARQLQIQQTRVAELPGLHQVAVPAMVLHGERDALCPAVRHHEIAAAIPGAVLVPVPDAGHLTPLEAPDAVATALGQWLRA
ncbi:pimeloyl-ACP methyl ester carboxylesterase [Propionibacteriaceae bacterium ES.041]|uniref:alpha/beta fold hydrolase n=1 Tax=Enemella evansiae TaxID=2016499 RepID=UPI000B96C0CF|nr:alpha/beta fold hydrolase [Enemella evansiae]OYO10852.1 alpha/beta hydrolase [Enemella evansiae]PFG65741.1 pimeloyl-ACP methyl ester carboxylesterase [Propionibacteriaceae bacterium ES.041]